jgi:hypothetical protein
MTRNNVSNEVKTPSKFNARYNKLLVGAAAAAPLFAMAEPLDMTDGVTQLGLAVAAVGALGAAKVAPAALTWVWSLVTGMARRG